MDYRKIKTKQELITLIFELLDDNDAVQWENNSAYAFLQAIAAWLNDSDGFYKNQNMKVNTKEASWQIFADALQATSVYE